jgi:hypothetical protein
LRDKIENGLRDGLIDWLRKRSQIVSACDTVDRLAVLAFNLSLRMLPKQNWQVRISKDLAHGYMKSGKLGELQHIVELRGGLYQLLLRGTQILGGLYQMLRRGTQLLGEAIPCRAGFVPLRPGPVQLCA